MEFRVRTKGNAQPRGRRRVYFTCHPGDFDRYFDMICEDIFASQEPAIFYTDDMSVSYGDEKELQLGEMNLFVIPVSYKLLSEPSRAYDEDYAFAREHHIPVLLIMVEPGLDDPYAERFGQTEYLDRTLVDSTAISYEEKLAKYLGSVLLSDETAERVRAAFDAYIFLSYRKKDRLYANELMRIIHDNPLCRDIAIWYDEYLVPGENFEDTIREAMDKSGLFTLVVTPSVTEEGNYVLTTEYPEAQKVGKKILAAR